jgi:hypothetical protein
MLTRQLLLSIALAGAVVLVGCSSDGGTTVQATGDDGTAAGESSGGPPAEDRALVGVVGTEVRAFGIYMVLDDRPLVCFSGPLESNPPSCGQFVRLTEELELPPDLEVEKWDSGPHTALVSEAVEVHGTVSMTADGPVMNASEIAATQRGRTQTAPAVERAASGPPAVSAAAIADPDSKEYADTVNRVAAAAPVGTLLDIGASGDWLVVTVVWADQAVVDAVLASLSPDLNIRIDSWLQPLQP